MMIWKNAALAAGCVALVSGGIVFAASASDVIAARQANFKVLGKAAKAGRDEFKGPSPSIAVLRASANDLAGAAVKVAAGFPKGTGPEAGVKTSALPAIWEKPEEFRADADKLVKASQAYQQATASGNLATSQAALTAVGGACKGCHEEFRAKDQ